MIKNPSRKVFGSGRVRFTGKSRPVSASDEKPCLIGDPHEVAQRLILKNLEASREEGTDPRRTNPLSIVPVVFTPDDYDPEYMREQVPTLNDLTGMAYCKLLHSGLYREHASEIIGFEPGTVRGWARRGRKRLAEITHWSEQAESLILEGQDQEAIEAELGSKPAIDTYARFAAASDRAYAAGERTLFSIVWDAALDGEVACCMWLLERRDPRRYGKAAARAVESNTNHAQDEDDHADPVAEFDALLAEYFERNAAAQGSAKTRAE